MMHQNNNLNPALKYRLLYGVDNFSKYFFILLLSVFLITSCTNSNIENPDTNNNNSNSQEISIYNPPTIPKKETAIETKSSNKQLEPTNTPHVISSSNPTATPVPVVAPIVTPNPTVEPTATSLPTPNPTVTPISLNPTATPMPNPTMMPVPTNIPTSPATETPTPTASPTQVPYPTPTVSPTPTVTPTPIYVASKVTSPCANYISPKVQPTAIPEPTPTITSFLNPLAYPTPTQTTNNQFARNRYSYDAKHYFLNIAFGPEYYVSGNECLEINPYLHKWTSDIKIRIKGYPTPEDIESVNSLVSDLNGLTQTIDISTVEKGGNIEIYFIPERQFIDILPSYIPTNWGFFWVLWDSKGDIYRSTILIDSSRISQRVRNHLITEELTQSLGLMKDSKEYINSIFYQGYTYTASLTPMDRDLVELLYNYDPGFNSGTSLEEAKTILSME